MSAEASRHGDDDRDFDNWLRRLAAQLSRSIVETIFDVEELGEEETAVDDR